MHMEGLAENPNAIEGAQEDYVRASETRSPGGIWI